MRRFLTKRVLLIVAVVLLLIPVSAIVGLYLFVNSPSFNERIRAYVVERTEAYTGAEVSLEGIRWSLKEQRIALENLTLRNTQAESEPALVHVESVTAGIHLRSLLQRRVDLFDLTIVNPEFNLLVDAEGRTNIPGPPVRGTAGSPETEFSVSIDRFRIVGGKAVINDRRFKIDLQVSNLVSDLRYNGETQVLSAQLAYDGNLKRPGQRAILYKMSSEFDFTRGTIVAQKVGITSGRTSVNLQGRIDNALTPEISGKLDYSGRFDSTFIKQFLPKDLIAGSSTAKGDLEFSTKRFTTKGDLSTNSVEFAGWKAGAVKGAYTYDNSAKRLNLTGLSTSALDGTAGGDVSIESLSNRPRFTVNIDYSNIDVAQLSSAYPWDPKYMIYSRADGNLQGSFEGRLEQFEFETTSILTSYSPAPQPGVIALPARGNLTAVLKPGLTEIKSSDIRFFDTRVQAEGKIAGSDAELAVKMESANLANLFFLYPEANGRGSFTGTIKGNLQKPTLEGAAVLDDHKYRDWTIRHAEGGVKLDIPTESADLKNVALRIGDSTATVSGTTRLDGTSMNLTVRSDQIRAEEFQSLIKERVGGILSGNVTLTSLDPLKVAGFVKSAGLTVRGHTFEAVEGNITYNDPSIEVRNLKLAEGNARLVADVVRYNPSTGELNAKIDEISSLPLSQVKELGIPQTLGGIIRSANLTVAGTLDKPQIGGVAVVEDLSFRSETFPRARLELKTDWPKLHVDVTETKNVSLEAKVDLERPGYPIEGSAKFTNYSLERLARFSRGTLIATGNANFTGQLNGQAPFSGKGVITSIDASIRDVQFHNAKPFDFAFDSRRISLDNGASFSGAYGTLVNVKGYVGLESSPPLDLEVTGNLDLAELATASANVDLSITGTVALLGHVGGTTADPEINGIAHISKGSLGHAAINNTSLSNVNGDLRFSENRVTFDNIVGQVGGGELKIRGDGIIQNSQIENLNVRIDANRVNLRYPRGLRSQVNGTLQLTGTSNAPILDGDLRLASLTYISEFETFLAFFRANNLNNGSTALDRLRLSIHVEGNRSVQVKNELADISAARVDLDIGGTWANPTLTGHIEITEGALLVQGKRYDITRGNIDFADRLKIDPIVDIQAETDVRDYRVILAVFGKPSDRIRIEPRSYPALPQLELISLIGGGKTQDELEQSRQAAIGSTGSNTNASLPTSEEVFQGAAANLLADRLRTSLGNRVGLMGLDWFQVSPHFDTAASNPSLRVTLSQQVSKDLSVTYSQDLASSQQRLVMIEYFVSKNLSIVASREETNEASALGLDIKLRKRY